LPAKNSAISVSSWAAVFGIACQSIEVLTAAQTSSRLGTMARCAAAPKRQHATKSEVGPRVLKLSRDKTFASLRSIVATIQYTGEDPKRVEFVGPSKSVGGPGPVVMIVRGYQTFVTDPARFGDFGPEWVRRFFEG
jgi:hypothetical protein